MAEGFKVADAYVEITAKDNTDADVTKVQTKLGKLAANVKLSLDTAATEAKIKLVQTYLDDLERKASDGFDVDADITQAKAKLDELKAKLDTLRDKKVEVEIDTDRGVSALTKLDMASTKSLGMFTAITAGAGAAAAAIGAMPAGVTALGGVIGVLTSSFSGVGDAMKTYGKDLDKGLTSQQAFADATKKLNQPQKDFVQQLIATQTALKPLKDSASQAFLPGLTQMLKDATGLFPQLQEYLRQTGTIMGDTAKKMGELFKSDQFKQNLQQLQQSSLPIVQSIGDSIVQLTDKFVQFGSKMSPAAQGFADFITKATDGIKGLFDALEPHADSFKKVFEGAGDIIKALLPVIGQIAGEIADSLGPALEKIGTWMQNNQGTVKAIVEALGGLFVALKAAGLVNTVTSWVTSLVTLFGKLATAIKKIPVGALKGIGAAAVSYAAGQGLEAGGRALKGNEDPTKVGSSVKSRIGDSMETGGQLLSFDFGAIWDKLKRDFAAFPAQFDAAFAPVKQWFTQTVPQFFQTQIVPKVQQAWTAVSNFFTQTIPQAFTGLQQKLTQAWQGVTTFFTTTIPQAFTQLQQKLTAAWQAVSTFFTQTVPQAWDAFKQMLSTKWQAISDFFSQTVSQAWDTIKQMFTDKWKAISDFFSTTVAQAWDTIKQGISDGWQKVSDFFTQTIPQAFNSALSTIQSAWQGIANFFTQTIPNAISSALNSLKSAVGLGSSGGGAAANASGNVLAPMASGGMLGGLNPMPGGHATVVPPNTWRVIGDNMTSPELYAPLDGSQRSLNLIRQGAAAFGQAMVPLNALGFASGGIAGLNPVGAAGAGGGASVAGTTSSQGIGGNGGAVLTALMNAWNQGIVPMFLRQIPEFLKKTAPAALNLGWNGIKTLLTKQLPDYLSKTANPAIKLSLQKIQDLLGLTTPKDITEKAVPALKTAGSKATDVLGQTMPQSLNQAQSSLSSAGQSVTNVPGQEMPQALNQAQSSLSDAGTKVTNEVGQTLPQGIQQAATSLQSACQQVISALQNMVQQIQQLAQQAQSAASSAGGAGGGGGGGDYGINGSTNTVPAGLGAFGMASGGITGLTPMSGSQATVVPPDTWRVIGDNMRHPELFAPLDGSQRSLSLIRMAAGLFGQTLVPTKSTTASAAGSVQSTAPAGARAAKSGAKGAGMGPVNIHINQQSSSPAETGRMVALALRRVC